MKRYSGLLMLALVSLVIYTSCLNDKDEATSTTYNDMAVSSFTLGALERTIHTKGSKGQDSTYTVEVTGSNYKFTIDQIGRRIFNTDSLPVNTNVSKVPYTLTTYNSSMPYFEDLEEDDALIPYSSTDSLDFSKPRKLRVYARNSSQYVTYTLTVNVHKEDGDAFEWERMPELTDEARAALDFYYLGKDKAEALGLKYVGHCTAEVYALTEDGTMMVSDDGGLTWEPDDLDSDASLLPTEDLAYAYTNYSEYDQMDYILLIGNRNSELYPDDEESMVWHKLVDYSLTSQPSRWIYMKKEDNNRTQYLPKLECLSLTGYNGKVLAFGRFKDVFFTFESKDSGITWQESTTFAVPNEIDDNAPLKVVVDSEGFIWLIQESVGQYWRGRQKSVAWDVWE